MHVLYTRERVKNLYLDVISPPLSLRLWGVVLGRVVLRPPETVGGVRSARLCGAGGPEKRARFRARYRTERPSLAGGHSVCGFRSGAVNLHGCDDVTCCYDVGVAAR